MKLTPDNLDGMDCRVPGRATGVRIPPEMEAWLGVKAADKPDGKPVRPVVNHSARRKVTSKAAD